MKRSAVWGAILLFALAGCGPSREELRNQAISEFQVGKLDSAKSHLKEIVDRYPGDSVSLYYLGRVCHAEGRLEWALFYYQCALTEDPGNAEAEVWRRRAEDEAGRTGRALRILPNGNQPSPPP